MKIGYIGGSKHHTKPRNIEMGLHSNELRWQIEVEGPFVVQRNDFQNVINRNSINEKETFTYKLKILKKEGELKFFYIFENTTKSEIENFLDECWNDSDTIGFDFD